VNDSVQFGLAEVRVMQDAINKASRVTRADSTAVVFKGAMNIKQDSARRISGHPRFRRLPAAITFDVYQSLTGPSAEIGPDHNRPQGNLGHIAEYGTSTSAPMPYMGPAGEAEEPRFARAVEELAVKALGL
jgi:hypothetical protein